jgi:uncharacterized protein YidB (DUF937 family)
MSGIEDILGGLMRGKSGGDGGLDSILGGLTGGGGSGGGGAGALMALAPLVMGLLQSGGLQKLLSGFQQQGAGDKAASWVGTGENEPVSGQEVRAALGEAEVREAAQRLGVSEDEAANVLAQVIPNTVDSLTPDGRMPSEEQLAELQEKLRAAGVQ